MKKVNKLAKNRQAFSLSSPRKNSFNKVMILLDNPYDDTPVDTGDDVTYNVDPSYSDSSDFIGFNDVNVASSQQMSVGSTDPDDSAAIAAGADPSNFPVTTSVSSDLTDLIGETALFAASAAGIPTSVSDAAKALVTEGIEQAAEYTLAEGLVTGAVGVAALEVVPIAIAAYEGYELGTEAGVLVSHVVSYVQSGEAANDINTIENNAAAVTTWASNQINQIITVFHPSSTSNSNQAYLPSPQLFAVGNGQNSQSSQPVTRNISFFYQYSPDWQTLINLTGVVNTSTTLSKNPSSGYVNPSPDGMLVGIADNGRPVASFIVRLGWHVPNTTTNGTRKLPPTLRFYNASWSSHVSIFSQGSVFSGAFFVQPIFLYQAILYIFVSLYFS